MVRVPIFIFAVSFGLLACEGDKVENPAPPSEILAAGGSQDASAGQTNGQDSGDSTEDQTLDSENIRLDVVPLDQLPIRIAECVQAGVAGAVADSVFSCNDQVLVDCNALENQQKIVAQNYVKEQLTGYSLFGCTLAADESPNFHYYLVDGEALRIFNLEVQRND